MAVATSKKVEAPDEDSTWRVEIEEQTNQKRKYISILNHAVFIE